jgi:hypothetical protein
MSGATEVCQLTKEYEKNVMISRVNGYNIIHLDEPTEEQITKRIKEMLDRQINSDLEIDCPLCRSIKNEPCDIVYFKQ